MDFGALLELIKNIILTWIHWNKMTARLIKTSSGKNIRLEYLLSNTGSHELIISDIEVEIGGSQSEGGGISIENLELPIKVKPNESEVISIEFSKVCFDIDSHDAFFVVVMTVYNLKGQQYYLYQHNPLDFWKISNKPFELDKKGAWLKERWGIEPGKNK
jgi:hypothetical protein